MKRMCGNICDKSQIGIAAPCEARTRPFSGDNLTTHSDILIHLSAATIHNQASSKSARLSCGQQFDIVEPEQKRNFKSSFDVKYKAALNKREKLMMGITYCLPKDIDLTIVQSFKSVHIHQTHWLLVFPIDFHYSFVVQIVG